MKIQTLVPTILAFLGEKVLVAEDVKVGNNIQMQSPLKRIQWSKNVLYSHINPLCPLIEDWAILSYCFSNECSYDSFDYLVLLMILQLYKRKGVRSHDLLDFFT